MKVIFTTGTFDMFHIGHLRLLKRASELGTHLIVGLNSDELIAYKQPVNTFEERKEMLESIEEVDKVVKIKQQDDKYDYIKKYGVDVFVLGSDYANHPDLEKIATYCEVKILDRTPNVSTTQIKELLKDEYHTFVIDIDDTISTTNNRDFEHSIPHREVIDKINKVHESGWKVILLTARGQKSCGNDIKAIEKKYRKVTESWLERNNVQYDELRFGKPNGSYYVDDKNISINDFVNGAFPNTRK